MQHNYWLIIIVLCAPLEKCVNVQTISKTHIYVEGCHWAEININKYSCVCACAHAVMPQTASLSVATLNLISPLSCTLLTAVYANITSGVLHSMCCSLLRRPGACCFLNAYTFVWCHFMSLNPFYTSLFCLYLHVVLSETKIPFTCFFTCSCHSPVFSVALKIKSHNF